MEAFAGCVSKSMRSSRTGWSLCILLLLSLCTNAYPLPSTFQCRTAAICCIHSLAASKTSTVSFEPVELCVAQLEPISSSAQGLEDPSEKDTLGGDHMASSSTEPPVNPVTCRLPVQETYPPKATESNLIRIGERANSSHNELSYFALHGTTARLSSNLTCPWSRIPAAYCRELQSMCTNSEHSMPQERLLSLEREVEDGWEFPTIIEPRASVKSRDLPVEEHNSEVEKFSIDVETQQDFGRRDYPTNKQTWPAIRKEVVVVVGVVAALVVGICLATLLPARGDSILSSMSPFSSPVRHCRIKLARRVSGASGNAGKFSVVSKSRFERLRAMVVRLSTNIEQMTVGEEVLSEIRQYLVKWEFYKAHPDSQSTVNVITRPTVEKLNYGDEIRRIEPIWVKTLHTQFEINETVLLHLRVSGSNSRTYTVLFHVRSAETLPEVEVLLGHPWIMENGLAIKLYAG